MRHRLRLVFWSVNVVVLFVIGSQAWCGIPQAPEMEGAAQGDYLKVANQLSITIIGYLIPLMYSASGLTYCAGMLYLFNQAKAKEEWGGFFKAGVIGLGLMGIILYLLNAIKKAI